jgi:circadian clock protein KaiC
VERIKPARVVFDSLSELRLLAGNPLRYRRQILALKQFFSGRRCTVLFLDDRTSEQRDLQVQSIAHGVIRLEQTYPEYGAERRRLIVIKFRGVKFRGGYHDCVIRRGGLEVFPRLIASEHRLDVTLEKLPSGISVVKKRGGEHERTIREFLLKGGRIAVGPPLREFRGVLTGVPVFEALERTAARGTDS